MTTPLDELISWATAEPYADDVVAARAEYKERIGEVFDDDRQFETRLTSFLEWYVCDRTAPHFGSTPAWARYTHALKHEGPGDAARFQPYTLTQYGLYVVEELTKGRVLLSELFSTVQRVVLDDRPHLGFEAQDVIEARLVPQERGFSFAPGHCWHPAAAAPLLRAEAKRLAKAGPKCDPLAFTHEAAKRSLKAERYRQIPLERIYDFSASAARV